MQVERLGSNTFVALGIWVVYIYIYIYIHTDIIIHDYKSR